jgi:hypothetical protein
MTTTTQITATNLADLNVLKLYEHYQILERSMPLLTPESQAICKAELEQTVALRSDKIDRIYYALAAHEDAIERVKKEQDLLAAAKKHHETNLTGLKGLLNWIRRSGVIKENKITGRNYEFVLVRKPVLTVTISSDITDWTEEERQKFCVVQEVTTTKQTVLRSMSGEVLEEKTDPKTKTETLPNLDELRNAYQTGQAIPSGIKIVQDYSIRPKRLLTTKRLDPETSEYNGEFLLQN